MPKPADHEYTTEDIREGWYDRTQPRKKITFLAPAEDVDTFEAMCDENDQYPWETFRIMMMTLQNYKRNQS